MLIRTTLDPRTEREVDDSEAEVLRQQGLLWDGTRDELQALLDRDPVGPLDKRVVLAPETPVPTKTSKESQ